ncbi:MAG TPA: hypothetical protein PKD23_10565 [Bellilinea sp.]|jgi:hypothetical protein|nr:hypothetical protein [Bellilinea sp.]
MTDLAQIIRTLDLTVLTEPKDFADIIPTGGYSADLLSCVMIGAPHGSIWVTLQAHNNIVAVAALLELSAVIITEGAMPDEATLKKANEEGINLLSSRESSYAICGRLWEMGIYS